MRSIKCQLSSDKKAKNGLSRDRRPDRPQVLLGLVLNEKGFPIHFEIFDGNLKDVTYHTQGLNLLTPLGLTPQVSFLLVQID